MATTTAAQRRAADKIVYDAFMETCPTRQVMTTIGEKWSSLLVNALADGPRRHAELRGVVAGISQKMLTQTLRVLERDGLVSRTVIPDVPVQVSYRLTDLGQSLLPVLQALKNWSEANIEAIMAARDAYDSRAA